MTCDYKNVFEHKQLTDVCDHLGNKWLDFIEECIAESNEAVKALRK